MQLFPLNLKIKDRPYLRIFKIIASVFYFLLEVKILSNFFHITWNYFTNQHNFQTWNESVFPSTYFYQFGGDIVCSFVLLFLLFCFWFKRTSLFPFRLYLWLWFVHSLHRAGSVVNSQLLLYDIDLFCFLNLFSFGINNNYFLFGFMWHWTVQLSDSLLPKYFDGFKRWWSDSPTGFVNADLLTKQFYWLK